MQRMLYGKNRTQTLKKAAFAVLCTVLLMLFAGCNEEKPTDIVEDIRDIQDGQNGGTTVVLGAADGYSASAEELDAAKSTLTARLDAQGVIGFEIEADHAAGQLILSFSSEHDCIEADLDDVCRIGMLTFREGSPYGIDDGKTYEDLPLVFSGADVESANAYYNSVEGDYVILIVLKDSGKEAFSEATARLYEENGVISIWMDNECISYPKVGAHITDGTAVISGGFDVESAVELANLINGGALPFELTYGIVE